MQEDDRRLFDEKMRRGVLVVDSLWGVGHRKRMALLASALSKQFSIDFFQTDPDVGIRAPSQDVRQHFIPSLFTFTKIGENHFPSPDEMIEREKKRIFAYESLLKEDYDFIFVDQYPFGKKPLRYDMDLLHAHLRKKNPDIKRISSFRGYQWKEFPEEMRPHVEETLKERFDLALFHIDERFREKLLPKKLPVSPKIQCTGFVVDERLAFPKERRRDEIVVAVGGGAQGEGLFSIAFELSKRMRGYRFRFFAGPFTRERASYMEPFSEAGYRGAVERAALFLSMGGYNTLMDHYVSKTPALVFPGAIDQPLLSQFFEGRGSVHLLREEDLSVERLHSLAQKQITYSEWQDDLNIKGAGRSLELVQEITARNRGP